MLTLILGFVNYVQQLVLFTLSCKNEKTELLSNCKVIISIILLEEFMKKPPKDRITVVDGTEVHLKLLPKKDWTMELTQDGKYLIVSCYTNNYRWYDKLALP